MGGTPSHCPARHGPRERTQMTLATSILAPFARPVVLQLQALGLTLQQACGVLASIQGESSFNPKALGDHGHAFGLCQVHEDRARLIRDGDGKGIPGCGIDLLLMPPVSDQIRAIWHELNYSERRALRELRATTTAYDAGVAFCKFYERPARPDVDCPKRGAWARDWFLTLQPTGGQG